MPPKSAIGSTPSGGKAEVHPHTPAYRVARRSDIKPLLAHLSVAPTSFGPMMAHAPLEDLLVRLIEEEAIQALALVDERGAALRAQRSVLACAITGFLRPDIADEWMARPPQSFIDETMRLEREGERPLLRRAEVGFYNASADGLDLAFLAYGSPVGDPTNPVVTKLVALTHDMFRVFHAGYHCRRAFHPAHGSPGGHASLLAMGFHPAHDGSQLLVHDLTSLDRTPFHPFIILRRATQPMLQFSRAEQDMLLQAILGLTDVELAQELGISEETVRKRWRRIFERVREHAHLRLFHQGPAAEPPTPGRGPEKRRRLLNYVASHLEELRPYSR